MEVVERRGEWEQEGQGEMGAFRAHKTRPQRGHRGV